MNIDKITRQHVLDAVAKIEREEIVLNPSTEYDVIINGNSYPPKEIMRYANLLANGKKDWPFSGGGPTNKYLINFGFEIAPKENEIEAPPSNAKLIELLKLIGRENASVFFNITSRLLSSLGIEIGDSRLTYGTRSDKRLSITIGQRYCLAYFTGSEYPWSFISNRKLKPSEFLQSYKYNGPPKAYYFSSIRSNELIEHFQDIQDACLNELKRTEASGFRKHNNSFFEKAVFELPFRNQLFETAFNDNPLSLTGNVWKLGCNWGSGKPSFYEMIKSHSIVIGVSDKLYSKGDLIVITKGFTVYALGKIIESPTPVSENPELKVEFKKLEIDYNNHVNIAKTEWYELADDEIFDYRLQQGICKVNDPKIRETAITIWNDRFINYWIFQCNPSDFDYDTAVRNKLLNFWTVTAHKDKIKKGDKAIIWLTGKKAGCYALARITSDPAEVGPLQDDYLWKNNPNASLKAGIDLIHNILERPLLWQKIKETNDLVDLKAGNQGTNFSATRKQYQTLLKLIDQNSQNMVNSMDLYINTILYGPPGTGKTYTTVLRAAEIIANRKIDLYDDALKIFKDNLHDRIEFITFHQNYSYEDFIQGLRPDIENSNLSFNKVDGIFKKIVDRAIGNFSIPIGIEFKDYIVVKSNSDIIELRRKKDGTIRYVPPLLIKDLLNGIADGKITLEDLQNRKTSEKHIADIIGSKVEKYYFGIDTTLHNICDYILQNKSTQQNGNYVLVIDEINRANISRVFGELITLIEPDKRSHGLIPLEARLPSGDQFIVPSNLYILGTMNTADKSIALLDIALRRRFEFEPMYPKYEIDNHEIYDVDILKNINSQIIKSKGYDFQIGHSYFMGENNDLVQRMNKKVIPLLLEYYMNDEKEVKGILSSAGLIIEDGSWPLKIKGKNDQSV